MTDPAGQGHREGEAGEGSRSACPLCPATWAPGAGCCAEREQVAQAPPPAQGEAPGSQSWLRTGTCRTARRRPGISAGGAWGDTGPGRCDETKSAWGREEIVPGQGSQQGVVQNR